MAGIDVIPAHILSSKEEHVPTLHIAQTCLDSITYLLPVAEQSLLLTLLSGWPYLDGTIHVSSTRHISRTVAMRVD
jgi:hypothetical protein